MKSVSDENKQQGNKFDEVICLLIMANHIHVWEYGYSFFMVALKMLEKGFKTRALEVVAGIGAIFDKNALKELTGN